MQSVYKVDKYDIQKMIRNLVEMPGTTITSNLNFDIVLKLWPKHIPDYGDAVVAAYCKMIRNSAIATFDKQFIKELDKLDLATPLFFE